MTGPEPDRPTGDDAATVPPPGAGAPDQSGGEERTIGPYRVLKRLGQGGFGVVYLAEQQVPVRRQLALKLVRPGLDCASLLARFESERQILALLDHPNIARFLDAGSSRDGHPYFAMEYVDGVPIDEHCDAHALSVEARVALFATVCDAVQHAHRKGILHRDLKPGNLLVGVSDGAPLPKVIDFGIAKALAPTADDLLLTGEGQLIGTPAYMSPEQISQGSMHLDTRTDVYALGVILYQLLTGVLPLRPRSSGADSIDELRRLIREVDPPPPSRRIAASAEGLAARARSCGMPARSLARRLRGDLDWIVAKALEKDVARRYGSAAELADDLRRHLRHEPVLAGPPSRSYRLARFARRHRTLVLSGAGMTLLLVLGIIGTSLGYLRARAAQHRTERALDTVAQVNGFLREMLASADPDAGFEPQMTIRHLLDETAPRVEATFAASPEVEAPLQLTIGGAYQSLGHPDLAQAHLRRSLERATLSDDPVTLLEANQTRLQLALVLTETGQLAEAAALADEAIARLTAAHGPHSAELAAALKDRGMIYSAQGRPLDARATCLRGLDVLAHSGVERIGLRGTLTLSLCYALEELGETADAERRLAAELPAHDARGRAGWSLALRMRSLLARLAGRRGAADQAERLLRTAREQAGALYGVDHPEYARTSNDLAELLTGEDRPDESEPLFRDALRILDARYPAGSPVAAKVMTNLAWLLGRVERDDEAIALLERADAMQTNLLGPKHPDVANTRNDLATFLRQRGDFDGAERLGEQALAIYVAAFGVDHRTTAIAEHNLGVTLLERGDAERALPHLQHASDILTRVPPTQDWMYAEFRKRIGDALIELGRFAEAEREIEIAYDDAVSRHGAQHRRAIGLIKRLIMIAVQTDRFDLADQWRARLPEAERDFGRQQQEERRRAAGS